MREVRRCLECKLVQYMTFDQKCRRCHVSFVPEILVPEIPAEVPAPVVQTFKLVPSTELCASFAKVVKVCRLAAGMSQRDIGRKLKTSRAYFSKVENFGCTPSIPSLHKFAKAFGVTPYFLISMAEGAQEL